MELTISEIPTSILNSIYAQARREYPKECCGVVFGPAAKPLEVTRARACKNVLDEYHARDPKNFPLTTSRGYFMDPKELLAIQKEIRQKGEEIRIIYHSHIDADAYFSEEDKRIALSDGEPAYPGVSYLVVSVRKGKVAQASLYHWDARKKDYI